MNDSAVHGDDIETIDANRHVPPVALAGGGDGRGIFRGLIADIAPQPRKGDWMQTFSGLQFWPLDPRPEEINIIDIGAALAKLCRYGGHALRFYSVAEHCVLLAREARRRGLDQNTVLCVLLHDASEAYLCDIIRPIKPALSNYIDIETRLMAAISLRFGFPWPMPAIVKEMDNAILVDEMQQGMAPPPVPWWTNEGLQPVGVRLQFWTPDRAFSEFMTEFSACGGAR